MNPLFIPRRWFSKDIAAAVLPIYAISAGAVAWGAYMLSRAAAGPDVIYSRDNPTPWNSINGRQVKLMAVNQKYEGKWSRF